MEKAGRRPLVRRYGYRHTPQMLQTALEFPTRPDALEAREILAVDPGAKGALALLDPVAGDLELFDMPRDPDGLVDVYALGAWVDARSHRIKVAILEHQQARPGCGFAFALGRNYGDLRGVLGANFIPMKTTRPAAWKKAMGVTKDKNSSRARASAMFPRAAVKFVRVKDDGRAEAALIAAFAARSSGFAHFV